MAPRTTARIRYACTRMYQSALEKQDVRHTLYVMNTSIKKKDSPTLAPYKAARIARYSGGTTILRQIRHVSWVRAQHVFHPIHTLAFSPLSRHVRTPSPQHHCAPVSCAHWKASASYVQPSFSPQCAGQSPSRAYGGTHTARPVRRWRERRRRTGDGSGCAIVRIRRRYQ